MKKAEKTSMIVIVIRSVFAVSILAFAAILLFATDSETSTNTKGTLFGIKLTTGMVPTEIVPGESFVNEPVITNDATKEMYVFVAVETPVVENESVYDYAVNDDWILVESNPAKTVWAYASDATMTTLALDEKTSPLMKKMTMKEISNAEFVELERKT